MQNADRISLLARLARSSGAFGPALSGSAASILALSAASYGARPTADATVPTGFDPIAVALFEAIVEGAYLVANADGIFDAREREMFEKIVIAACGGLVLASHVAALVSELQALLSSEGMDARVRAVGRAVTRKEHGREILRIAVLIAQASDEVSPVERGVLDALARHCLLDSHDVDQALLDVRAALTAAR
jgi:tellurite resistance protein